MRGLKIAAIASVSLLLVMLLLVGYLFATADVQVVNITAEGTPASNDAETFQTLQTAVTDGTFSGTMYYQAPTEWKPAEDYVFLDYTLRVRNNCLVAIDMVEVQVVPQTTDILQMGSTEIHAIQPKSEGEVTARVLAPKDTHSVREVIVTYYVWGVSFRIKTMYGG